MSKQNSGLLAATIAVAFWGSASTAGAILFQQDFASDLDGINARQFESDTTTNLNRVASGGGNLGMASRSSGFHLETGLVNGNAQSGFGYGMSWNDSAGAGAFQNGYGVRFSAYLDNPNRLLGGGGNAYEAGDGWFFQSTLLRSDGQPPISGGGFGIQLSSGGEWMVAATGLTLGGFEYGLHHGAHPESGQASFSHGNTLTAAEGWYTFETRWWENTMGGVDQVSSIYDADGSLVYSATVENAVNEVADAGQVGTAWVGQDGPREPNETGFSGIIVPQSLMGDLAIDNVSVIPEPRTAALALGLLTLVVAAGLRRRRRA